MTNRKMVSLYSNWMMITTSIHHLYGAYIYNTPERLHVLAISIPVIVLTWFFNKGFEKKKPQNHTLVWVYASVITLFSLLLIGVLEGTVNHILKNALFFSNVPEDAIKRFYGQLYDPSIVEMPNDIFFEISGMVQGILAIPLAIYLIRFVNARHKENNS